METFPGIRRGMARVRAHVVISGYVQGVFFRSYTKEEAEMLGITGWVMNCAGGDVEAVFEGEKEDVEKMILWCQKGPPSAHVHDVQVAWEGYAGDYDAFSMKY